MLIYVIEFCEVFDWMGWLEVFKKQPGLQN